MWRARVVAAAAQSRGRDAPARTWQARARDCCRWWMWTCSRFENLLWWQLRWFELGIGLCGHGGDVVVAVVCRGGWRSG